MFKEHELEACTQFLSSMSAIAVKEWGATQTMIEKYHQDSKKVFKENNLAFSSYYTALITLELQALPNLLRSSEAKKAQACIFHLLADFSVGSILLELIEGYQAAWDEFIDRPDELPITGVVARLYHNLQINLSVNHNTVDYMDPLFLMMLTERLIVGGGYWKEYLSKHPHTFLNEL